MIRVAIEIRERTVVRRVRITADSLERALELGGSKARLIFPTEPNPFFAPQGFPVAVEERSAETSERRLGLAA